MAIEFVFVPLNTPPFMLIEALGRMSIYSPARSFSFAEFVTPSVPVAELVPIGLYIVPFL